MLDALSPARRRFVLLLGGGAVLAVVAVIVTVVLSREPPVRPVPQDSPGPVLLVPGYGGSTASLDVLAAALQDAGRTALVVPSVGSGTGDLLDQARSLHTAALAAMADSGSASVDVVGYSAGGVVARLWVSELGGGSIARRVVTLASPNHGTDLAALAGDLAPDTCPVACLQLASDSDLLRGLNAGDETPAGPRWVAIWTTDDRTVVPPDSGRLEGATGFAVQSVCPGLDVTHGDMPRDPVVTAMTLLQLDADPPRLPGPEVCGRG